MEFVNSLIPHYREEFFESSMDLFQLESRNRCFTERNSILPLSEANRAVTECIQCDDRPDYECTECTCQICGHKTKAAKRYRCNSCKKVFHEWCQNISETDSSEHWQCMNCKPKDQIVPASELVSVKYTRQIIIRQTTRKINNAPRSRECTSVPANHFGPIPDIPVGTCWEYRLQASEAGVHRPLVAGIHGRENEGAYSIVLSGVYPDDFDGGDEFFYSGCGGKEKDPSKRLGAQVRNQTLTKHNRALALCCDCPINDKEGGTAKNWKNGKQVRVIRNYKLSKFSKYAPKEGNRYDGIYKVVKYFPQKGRSGFMIWRYLLKRDDPIPAPWTSEGKRLIRELGLKMIRASPRIAEKAEEFESTTYKLEINDEEPLKKKLKRVYCDIDDPTTSPKMKIAPKLEIDICSPASSPVPIKREIISPPRTPEPEINSSDIPTLAVPADHAALAMPITEIDLQMKMSPKLEDENLPISPPESIKEEVTSNFTNTYLEMTSVSESTCTTNSFTNSFINQQNDNCLTAYSTNYVSPLLNSCPSMSSIHSSYLSKYTESSPIEPRVAKPLPILRISAARSLCINPENDPIKLPVAPQPVIMQAAELTPIDNPSIDQHIKTEQEEEKPIFIEQNGRCELNDHIQELITKDVLNKYWWDTCIEKYLPLGKQIFLENIQEMFTCPCCHKIIDKPVTLRCEHNACLDCLSERFEILRVKSCPTCQEHLGHSAKLRVNENLSNILFELFPAYNLKLSYFI